MDWNYFDEAVFRSDNVSPTISGLIRRFTGRSTTRGPSIEESEAWTYRKEVDERTSTLKYFADGPSLSQRAGIIYVEGRGYFAALEYEDRYYLIIQNGRLYRCTNGLVWASKDTNIDTTLDHDAFKTAANIISFIIGRKHVMCRNSSLGFR